MYIPEMAQQTRVFLLCVGIGFVLGILYDVVRMLRKIFFTSRKALYVQDILYFVICTFCIFLFLLYANNGGVRAFNFVGMALGWVIYYFTLGVLNVKITEKIVHLFHKIFKKFQKSIIFLKKHKNKEKSTCKLDQS